MTLRVPLALLGAAVLVAGIYTAALRGLADAHYTNARLTLVERTPAGGAPPAEVLASASASIRQARELEPANPHFVEMEARLREQRALALPAGDPAIRDGLLQALAQFRDAAAMRPGSPYVWASIAMLKARLNDMDFELYGALERAARLGPWEPQVQIAIIDVGLAAWPWLARSGRVRVLEALERAMLHQEPEVRRIAAIHGTLPRVCAAAAPGLPRLGALCVRK